MALEIQGKPGQGSGSDGGVLTVRLGRDGSVITKSRFREEAERGNVYNAASAAAGVAPGESISTTASLSIYNPAGSGVNLVIKNVRMAYRSGTLGTGVMHYCLSGASDAAPSSGTAITPRNALSDNAGSPQAVVKEGSTVVAPTPVRVFCFLPPILATSVVQPDVVNDDLDGAIVVAPGTSLQMQATAAADTSPKVCWSITWEEIPEL